MKLTRAANYAIAALTHLAKQKDRTRPTPSHTVAKAEGIPERFLLKVLKPLVSADVLHSIKGPNGGYRLAKESERINMLQILEAVEGPLRAGGNAPWLGNLNVGKNVQAMNERITTMERKELARTSLRQLAGKA